MSKGIIRSKWETVLYSNYLPAIILSTIFLGLVKYVMERQGIEIEPFPIQLAISMLVFFLFTAIFQSIFFKLEENRAVILQTGKGELRPVEGGSPGRRKKLPFTRILAVLDLDVMTFGYELERQIQCVEVLSILSHVICQYRVAADRVIEAWRLDSTIGIKFAITHALEFLLNRGASEKYYGIPRLLDPFDNWFTRSVASIGLAKTDQEEAGSPGEKWSKCDLERVLLESINKIAGEKSWGIEILSVEIYKAGLRFWPNKN